MFVGDQSPFTDGSAFRVYPGIELVLYGRVVQLVLTNSEQSIVDDLPQLLCGRRLGCNSVVGFDESVTDFHRFGAVGLLGGLLQSAAVRRRIAAYPEGGTPF